VASVFERFSAQARRVVSLAGEEAQLLGHARVGTEHLLLGVLAEGSSRAARQLAAAGATLAGCREMAAEAVGDGTASGTGGSASGSELPLTERAGRSLERASRAALRRRDGEVDAAHILVSVLDVEGRAGQVLRSLSVDVAALRRSLEIPADPLPTPPPPAAGGDEATAGPSPRCATCGADLAASLAERTLTAAGEEGRTAAVRVVYCRACGAGIGAAPVGD
jgi:ATP-dependent Clp protease ATP-binding subunit ClpA